MAPAPDIKQPGSVPAGWILYDDSCGFCRRWAIFWENTLRRRGFGIAPLSTDGVASRWDLPEEEVRNDLWLLLPDGRHIAGAEAYRYTMKRIWWTYPLYLFSIAPVGRGIFNRGCRTFAACRYRISDLCGLPNGASGENHDRRLRNPRPHP